MDFRIRPLMFFLLTVTVGAGCGERAAPVGKGNKSVLLSWRAPTHNQDQSRLKDLAGYRIYVSTRSGKYSKKNMVAQIPAAKIEDGKIQYRVEKIGPGSYYFVVTAYDHDKPANESEFSNELKITLK